MAGLISLEAMVAELDYAFQPIVSVLNGETIGFEALLRNTAKIGFRTIEDLFTFSFVNQQLHALEKLLREKAIQKFLTIKRSPKTRLFFNVDNRSLDSDDYKEGATTEILSRYNVSPSLFCIEISEKQDLAPSLSNLNSLCNYKQQHYKVVIDDFGTGFAGLRMFYHLEPDFIKIDRFFLAGITSDGKKRLFVEKIVKLAHMMGISVVAEGVESEKEYMICRDIGFNYVQGFLIERPQTDVSLLRTRYPLIAELNSKDRRKHDNHEKIIYREIKEIPAINIDTDMLSVFEIFRKNKDQSFFPVVDHSSAPLGVIHEVALKEFVYSTYGKYLLQNRCLGKDLKNFIQKIPVVSISTPLKELLEIFAADRETQGLLITENDCYVGFLSAKSLLNILNERKISLAKDQNPLTGLPGNRTIEKWVMEAFDDPKSNYIFAYYDFDFFKPFNDKYGFRKGDRAINMFAEQLRKHFTSQEVCKGHIGGDDFFALFKNRDFEEVYEANQKLETAFRHSVEIFYDDETRTRGEFLARDRNGSMRHFPLLRVSVVLLNLPLKRRIDSIDFIDDLLMKLKKGAKKSENKICAASVL